MRRLLAPLVVFAVLCAPGAASAQMTDTPPPGITGTATSDPKAGLPDDPAERRRALEERIAQADLQKNDLLAQVHASDRRRQELDDVVSGLDREIGALNAQLAAIRAELDETTFAYVSAERGVDGAAGRLAAARRQVARRATEVYKQGPAGMVNFVLDARDLEEVATRASYVKAVVEADRERIDDMRSAEDDYRHRSAALSELKDSQMTVFNRVTAVQDEIEANRARQERARAEVAAEADNKRALLAKVESDRATWQAMIARELQDSLGIMDLLAAYQGGQNVPPGVVAGMFSFPVLGPVGSVYGWRVHPIFGTGRLHAGVDFSADEGTPIRAPAAGTVVFSGWMGGYGNTVVIDHSSRVATLHAHQSVLLVEAGDVVKEGDTVGLVGSTGWSTGPHLHFEVRVNGEPVDPAPWLRLP